MNTGSKYLKITSILQIFLGLGSILLIRMLLAEGNEFTILSNEIEPTELLSIIYIYAFNIFKILTGIIGFCLSNKKTMLTVICGILSIGIQATSLLVGNINIINTILDMITILIPSFYLYGAYLNYKTEKKINYSHE